MSFLSPIFSIFKGHDDKPAKVGSPEWTATQMQPLIDLQKKIGDYGLSSGKASFEKASGVYGDSLDFYKKILTGSDEDLLKLFNADEFTKSADESQATAFNLGGRSGARASVLGQTGADRSAMLEKIFTGLRAQAPDKMTAIGQLIANMGSQQLSGGFAGVGGATSGITDLASIYQHEEDRRTQLISSIVGAAAGAAGAAFAG